jgi:hypothetical protein
MFPDPSTSPASYARALCIDRPQAATVADAEVCGWIKDFSRVMRLVLGGRGEYLDKSAISLAPFHGFSLAIRSLHMTFDVPPSSQIFNLILSFPLLEDLTVIADYKASIGDGDDSDGLSTVIQRSALGPTNVYRVS